MTFFVCLIALAFPSYLLGSIPAGYLAGRIAGVDVRKSGSGNIGATNVVRILGKRYGYPVFAVDFLKGAAAVMISILIAKHLALSSILKELVGVMAGVCCVLGHAFPVWLNFKGGKGVATSLGVVFGLMPTAAIIMILVWAITFELSRYVSIASMVAALALPLTVALIARLKQTDHPVVFYFSICLAAIIVFRHRSNLSRLKRGTEPRFRRR